MDISVPRILSRSRLAALGVLTIAMIGLLAAQGCSSSPTGSNLDGLAPAPEVGRLAPDFTLVGLDGNQVSLSDFRGKTVFVNFWATWCPPCRAEMPEMEAVYQEYKDRDVVIIGVDIVEPEDTVRQYVQEGGYSWTFVLDTTGEVNNNYRVTSIPTSFFLDREGIIRAVNIGPMNKRAIESTLALAMN